MYEDYFGLDRSPFKITPDTSLFYEGGKRGDILAALVYAVHRGEGIIKVVGEVGSGKTMLCRMLQLKLPDSVDIIYIANPSVSPEDILFVIAHELSLPVDKSASKHEVMHLLQDFLLQRHIDNRQVVLFVEEAQGMPIETLEEIRLLSNLETDQHKLLQIILFGQPELDANLAGQEIRQLRERITHDFQLEPLTDDEIYLYLNFRMREVGYTGPELISKSLAKRVARHSGGLLRRINIIADKILLSAFAEGTHNLSKKHVMAAVEDSSFHEEAESSSTGRLWLLFALLLMAAFAFAVYQTRDHWMNTQAASVPGETAGNSDRLESGDTSLSTLAIEKASPVVIEAESAMVTEEAVMMSAEPVEESATMENQVALLDSSAEEAATTVDAPRNPDGSVEVVDAPETGQPGEADGEVGESGMQSKSQLPLQVDLNQDVDLTLDNQQWLNNKLVESLRWLSNADRGSVSIQVLMRSKSASEDLVNYLRYEWPLDIEKTYVYEIDKGGQSIYRVFYSNFGSMVEAQQALKALPEPVQGNAPYLNSVYRMQEALL